MITKLLQWRSYWGGADSPGDSRGRDIYLYLPMVQLSHGQFWEYFLKMEV